MRSDDCNQVMLAASTVDWGELVKLIAILLLALVSGLVTLLKSWMEKKQQAQREEAARKVVPNVLVDEGKPVGEVGPRARRPAPLLIPPAAQPVGPAASQGAPPPFQAPRRSPHVSTPIAQAAVRREARNREVAEQASGLAVAQQALRRTAMQVLGQEELAESAPSPAGLLRRPAPPRRGAAPLAEKSPETPPPPLPGLIASIVADPRATGPAAMRRALIMSEIIGRPIALRDTPFWDG